jgi:glutamine cyclotransferase
VLVRLLALSFVTACVGAGVQPPKASRASYSVIRAFPHDRAAFTQGFEYFDGVFYEGTGLSGKSSIRKVNVETGEVLQRRDVAAEYFGEGITIWRNDLIELTWQSKVAFVYDRATFAPKRTFSYPGEGWGLTHDDTALIMSDGSAALRFLDPVSFAERRRVTVTDGGVPVPRLNELEYVKGQVYANVWQTYLIARIAPDSGRVVGWIDLTGLLTAADSAGADVMNGIAYDAAHDRLFVTGKLWPKVFEIKIR